MFVLVAGSCDWLSDSGERDVLVCGDGSRCNGKTAGWGCCETKGGRKQCPLNIPTMCTSQTCGGGDFCCEAECSSKGGERDASSCGQSKSNAHQFTVSVYVYVYVSNQVRVHACPNALRLLLTPSTHQANGYVCVCKSSACEIESSPPTVGFSIRLVCGCPPPW